MDDLKKERSLKRKEHLRRLDQAGQAAEVQLRSGGMVEPPPGISKERWEELVTNEAERRRSGRAEPLRKKVGSGGRKPLEQLLVERSAKKKAAKKRNQEACRSEGGGVGSRTEEDCSRCFGFRVEEAEGDGGERRERESSPVVRNDFGIFVRIVDEECKSMFG